MVNLYVADISALLDPFDYPKVMEGLSEERKKKILNCKQKQKRLQSLGAGILLNKVLRRYGTLPERVRTEPNGKPVVDGICFNLSHSGELVICAISQKPVGCDIEQLNDAPKCVVEHAFSVAEKEYLQQFSGVAYNREFFRIWTKKESFLKMTGMGIRVPLHTLEIKGCYLKEYEIPGYQVTVCSEENTFSELFWVEI